MPLSDTERQALIAEINKLPSKWIDGIECVAKVRLLTIVGSLATAVRYADQALATSVQEEGSSDEH